MPFADRGDAYLGFLVEVEALLGRPVDLVEVDAVRNPYLRQGIDASREPLLCRVIRALGSPTSSQPAT